MSLDTDKLHRLRSKSFDRLYTDHAAKWREMVENARKYAQGCVGAGEQIKIGDVVAVIQHAIRIDPTFEAHVKKAHLPQKYWVTWFAEYILDHIYPSPVPAAQAAP